MRRAGRYSGLACEPGPLARRRNYTRTRQCPLWGVSAFHTAASRFL